jgi:hypothetical protein
MLHKLKGFTSYKLDDEALSNLMRGAENALMAEPQPLALLRTVMTLPILKLLGHQFTVSGLTGFFS